ncbi:MAG TPA: hypothetical protein VEW42_04620 [Candidatus Eisenbacteria bacterium]|nr:hypothetical protein [Candidatus Eisenbacteria bacterium]
MSTPEKKIDGPERHGVVEEVDLGGVVDAREKIGGIGPREPIPGPVAEPFPHAYPKSTRLPRFTVPTRDPKQGNTPGGN